MWVDPKNDITTIFMIQSNEMAGKFPHPDYVYAGYKGVAAPVAPSAAPIPTTAPAPTP